LEVYFVKIRVRGSKVELKVFASKGVKFEPEPSLSPRRWNENNVDLNRNNLSDQLFPEYVEASLKNKVLLHLSEVSCRRRCLGMGSSEACRVRFEG
jgi:hypothetical protein